MTSLDPPDNLNPDGKRIWREAIEEIMAAGSRAKISVPSLLAYVEAVRQNERIAGIANQTDVLVNRNGNPTPNPVNPEFRANAKIIAEFARQFGLNRRSPMAPQTAMERGRWCDEHQRYECVHNRSRGRGQCHAPRVTGLDGCPQHAGVKVGTDPRHLLAVERIRNPLSGEPMNIGPAEALLWRVRVLAGEVARLDEKVASLEHDELVWGTVTEETADTDGGGTSRTVKAAKLNVWLILRAQRESALQSACEAALRANIEERLVRLAEQEGAVIYRLITAVLGDLGISADDPRVAEVVPRRLRELTA